MTQALEVDGELRLRATEQALVREFGPVLGEDRVLSDVREVLRQYEDAPVRTFVAVLVEREARARLRGLSLSLRSGSPV
jgi:hypothetical protein